MFDVLAAIGVLIVLGGVIISTKLCAKKLTPEGTRKIVHITMGCVALSFPFVFTYKLSVISVGLIAIAVLLVLRFNGNFRGGLGSVLLGVQRKSFGEIYFVISIVIVFVFHKSTVEYLIPISVLTFADSVAALIGTSYGRYNMAHQQEDTKSREGSVMFFIVAFMCALIPLQLMTEIGKAEVLMISFLIGLLAAMIETVSRNGNDNLLLPLLIFSLIHYNTNPSLEQLLANFGIILFFFVALLFTYKMTNITKLSISYGVLVGYVIMLLGGMLWAIPPLTLLVAFGTLPMMNREEKQMTQTYKVIESNTIIGVICLCISVIFQHYRDVLYIAFSLSFACLLAINTYSRFIHFVKAGKVTAISSGLAKATFFIALPTLYITKMSGLTFALYLMCLVAAIPPAIYLNKKYDYQNVGDKTFNANKFLTGTVVGVFVAILILTGGCYDIP